MKDATEATNAHREDGKSAFCTGSTGALWLVSGACGPECRNPCARCRNGRLVSPDRKHCTVCSCLPRSNGQPVFVSHSTSCVMRQYCHTATAISPVICCSSPHPSVDLPVTPDCHGKHMPTSPESRALYTAASERSARYWRQALARPVCSSASVGKMKVSISLYSTYPTTISAGIITNGIAPRTRTHAHRSQYLPAHQAKLTCSDHRAGK